MSIVVFDYKNGAPTSVTIRQNEVMAIKPENGELKYIGYFKGHNSVFTEDILDKNKDLKPNRVPEFTLNPTRNKCELRFDDSDKALLNYLQIHPDYNKKFELYSEEIESERKLGKAEAIEKALDYIKESDDLRINALGLAVLGLKAYNKSIVNVKAELKDKAINSPKEVITACEDPLFDNKFIAALALCSGVVETNNTMTAIIWGDNKGRIINIATGEDFITKFAKHLGEKSPENQSLLQEIGNRLELTKKQKKESTSEAEEIKRLKAELERVKLDKEIAEGKLSRVKTNDAEPTVEDLVLIELREKYVKKTGKNVPFRYQNDSEWLQLKIDEK